MTNSWVSGFLLIFTHKPHHWSNDNNDVTSLFTPYTTGEKQTWKTVSLFCPHQYSIHKYCECSIFKNVYHIKFVSCSQSFKAFPLFLEKAKSSQSTPRCPAWSSSSPHAAFLSLEPLVMLVFLSETSHSLSQLKASAHAVNEASFPS